MKSKLLFFFCLLPSFLLAQTDLVPLWKQEVAASDTGNITAAYHFADSIAQISTKEQQAEYHILAVVRAWKWQTGLEVKNVDSLNFARLDKEIKKSASPEKEMLTLFKMHKLRLAYQRNTARMQWIDAQDSLAKPTTCIYTWGTKKYKEELMQCYEYLYERLNALEKFPTEKYLLWYNKLMVKDGVGDKETQSEKAYTDELKNFMYHYPTFRDWMLFSLEEELKRDEFMISSKFILYSSPELLQKSINVPPTANNCVNFWRYLHQQRLQFYLQKNDYFAAIDVEISRLLVERERIGNDTLYEKALRASFLYFRTLQSPTDKKITHDKAVLNLASYLMALYCEKYPSNPQKYISSIQFILQYVKDLQIPKKNEYYAVRQIRSRWKNLCYPRHSLEGNNYYSDYAESKRPPRAYLPQIIPISYQNNPALAVYVIRNEKTDSKQTDDMYFEQICKKHKSEAFTDIASIPAFDNQHNPNFWKCRLTMPDSCQDHCWHSATIVLPPLGAGEYLLVIADSGEWRKGRTYSISEYTISDATTSEYIQTEDQAKVYIKNKYDGKAVINLPMKIEMGEASIRKKGGVKEIIPRFTLKDTTDNKGAIAFNLRNRIEQVYISSQDPKQYFYTAFAQYEHYADLFPEDISSVEIFTDRSIYRPNQTVYFKGIVTRFAAREIGNSQQMPKTILCKNQKVILFLKNALGETIEKKVFTTNEYGSINGSFYLPENIALGTSSIDVFQTHDKRSFEVAEYRRPQMELIIDNSEVNTFYKGDTLTVTGHTMSMNALPLQGVAVNAKFIISKYKKIEPKLCPKYVQESKYSDVYSNEDYESDPIPDLFDIEPFHQQGNRRNYRDSPTDSVISIQNITTKADGSFSFSFVIPKLVFEQLESPNLMALITATDAGETAEYYNFYSLSEENNLNSKAQYLKVTQSQEASYKHRLTHLGEIEYKDAGNVAVFVERLKVPEHPILFTSGEGKSQLAEKEFRRIFPYHAYTKADEKGNYPVESLVFKETFAAKGEGKHLIALPKNLTQGEYQVRVVALDKKAQGDTFTLILKDTLAKNYAVPVLLEEFTNHSSFEVGQTLHHTLYTSEDSLWIHYLIAFDDADYKDLEQEQPLRFVQDTMILLRKGRNLFSYPITEQYSHQFTIHITGIFQDYKIERNTRVAVMNPKEKIQFQWITFRNYLTPGQKETWKLKLKGPNNEKVSAEVLAGMYDASLDKLHPFSAPFTYFDASLEDISIYSPYTGYYNFHTNTRYEFEPAYYDFNWSSAWYNRWDGTFTSYTILKKKRKRGHRFYGEDAMWWVNPLANMYGSTADTRKLVKQVSEDADQDGVPDFFDQEPDTAEGELVYSKGQTLDSDQDGVPDSGDDEPHTPVGYEVDNRGVRIKMKSEGNVLKKEPSEPLHIRKKLQETAFFYPNLVTDADGVVTISFESPEALTKWHFYALAHTKDMRINATDTMRIYTRKQLSIVAAFPRYLYEKDVASLTAKVINSSEKAVSAKCSIHFFEGETEVTDKILSQANQEISIASKQSQNVFWKVNIPMGYTSLRYQVIVEAAEWSDGEENLLPILPLRKEVTESFPLFAHRNENRTFSLAKWNAQLPISAELSALKLSYNPEPLYNVLMALPYLMEFPHECSEQMMSRYYANKLASYLMNQHPEMAQVLQSYRPNVKDTPFLKGKEKQEEAYWKNIQRLMNTQRMADENKAIVEKLKQRKTANGILAWFDGMPGNVYISRHVATLIAELQNKGIPVEQDLVEIKDNAIRYLDKEFTGVYKEVSKVKDFEKKNHLYEGLIEYLYLRTLDTADFRRNKQEKAFAFWLQQAATYGMTRSIDEQAILALVLAKNKQGKAAEALFTFWKNKAEPIHPEYGTTWIIRTKYEEYEVSIETHARWLRAFREGSKDTAFSELLQQWLISQKEGVAWETTMATTAACDALIASAYKGVSAKNPITINIQNNLYLPEKEKGLYEVALPIMPKPNQMPESVTISTTLAAPAYSYGALSRTYSAEYQDFKAVGAKTTIQKTLYVEQGDGSWKEVEGVVQKGTKVKVRLVITNEVPMEYVHIEDRRAAGLESIQVLSGYECSDNLCYYQSIKDAATHFFLEYLEKGTHILEYELRTTHLGNFNAAISEVECMYTPSLRAHTKGEKLEVKE